MGRTKPKAEEATTITKLSYYSLPTNRPDPPGMRTPPLRPPVAVPFLWEESPGKPKSSTVQNPNNFSSLSTNPKREIFVNIPLPPSAVHKLLSGGFDGPSVLMGGNTSRRSSSFVSSREGLGRSGRKEKRSMWFWGRRGKSSSVSCSVGEEEMISSSSRRRMSCSGFEGEGSFRFYLGKYVVNNNTDASCGGGGEDEVKTTMLRKKERKVGASSLLNIIYYGVKHTMVVPWRRKHKREAATAMVIDEHSLNGNRISLSARFSRD